MTRFVTQFGDTGIPLAMRLRSQNEPVNLTGIDSIKLYVLPLHKTTPFIINGGLMVADADQTWNHRRRQGARGVCRYFWTLSDATIPRGLYEATAVVTYAGGAIITFPRSEFGEDHFEIKIT